ncbi:hypothetical protein E2493_20075 [Sphingomonas parva]|uniref:Lipoprotein n=1 Tax=Sphingomonas parva TaxID=2555898 RepID=A0A4Y8ZKJ2_9SPHN|nr:hypothetical protein [Sphingomonas parva]TFI56464.1 hypothetical protein E2493_20075 [Sphingomonas parva]
MKSISFAVAAAAALAACSGGTPSDGGDDPAAALVTTAQALQKKLGAPGEKAQMPAADDPDVKAFDAEADKALTALGTPAMPVQGLDSYERLCGPAAGITAAYVSAGLGATADGALPTDDAAKVAKMNENATRYMGQMLVPLLYSAHCTAVHLPAVDKELAGQDLSGKEAALAQVRDGAYGQVAGLLQMAAAGDIAPAQRSRVIDLLVRDAGHFGVGFTQAQRRELAAMIDQAAAASPEVKAKADGLKRAIAGAACATLCSA